MTRPLSIRSHPRTLKSQFLLIVFLGAVLPLALVGVWLTRSAERAGTALLHTQLEAAADVMMARFDRWWSFREGELQLLASNTSAHAALSDAGMSSADSAYLLQAARAFAPVMSSIKYVDPAGRERWSFVDDRIGPEGRSFRSQSGAPLRDLRLTLPIAEGPRTLGELVVRLRLASAMSTELGQALAMGAAVTITGGGGVLWSLGADSSTSGSGEASPGWEVVQRTARVAPVTLIVTAPSAPFVKPFEGAARTGLAVLMFVALVALTVSAVLTSRATRSLARLSQAATAVAAGDLEWRVPPSHGDEIGQLSAAFNEMTESLRRTLGELSRQRALAAVGEFAASLSHEVRNGLTAVGVDLQHAKRLLPPGDPGTALMIRALGSVRRLDSAVTSALRVARSGEVAFSRVELAVVLEYAMRAATPSYAERGATLEPLRLEGTSEVLGDASALEQLFLNLLINAGEALAAGGRTTVDVRRVDGHATVRIVDTGNGMPAEALASFGQPFRSTKPHGTGLGVPIARRIVAAHGGEFLVESVPQVGTTATVRLPLAPALE
jgi:signal transduction histidine kinase